MSSPLFSVVTIAYNDLAGLRAVADSLFTQDFADWEWCIVDGGSRDGSADYLAGLADPRVSFVSEPDRGIYNAMNKGVACARGDYLIFMNSGDAFAALTELSLAAGDLVSQPDLLYGDALEVDPDTGKEHLKRARSHRFAWYSMFTHHQAIYYRRGLFDRLQYDETFKLAADWVLTLDALRLATRVVQVRRPICRFRRGGASFGDDRTLADSEAARVYSKHSGLPAPLAALVFQIKTGINRLRFRFPMIYDRLRMRGRP